MTGRRSSSVANQDLEGYLQQISRTRVNRRGSCGQRPDRQRRVPAACGAVAARPLPPRRRRPPAGRPRHSAAPTAAPVAVEKELFMYNWATTSTRATSRRSRRPSGSRSSPTTRTPSNEELLTKLQGGAKGQWDVGAPTAEFVPALRDQGSSRSSTCPRSRTPSTSKRRSRSSGGIRPTNGSRPRTGEPRDRRPDEGSTEDVSQPGRRLRDRPYPAGSSSWTRRVMSSPRRSRRWATR